MALTLAAVRCRVLRQHTGSRAYVQGQLADDRTAVSVMAAFTGAVRRLSESDDDDVASFMQDLRQSHEQGEAAVREVVREQAERLRRGVPMLVGRVASLGEGALGAEQRRQIVVSLQQAVLRCMPEFLAEGGSQWCALLAAAESGDSGALLVGRDVPTGAAGRVCQQDMQTSILCMPNIGRQVKGRAKMDCLLVSLAIVSPIDRT